MDDRIAIKLFAGLGESFSIPDTLDLSKAHTIREILNAIGMPEEKAAIVFVNNRHAKLDDIVKPGEILAIFPPIGGG